MNTVEEARSHILRHICPMPAVSVGLSDALDCVLAEPVSAPFGAPRFDDSEMDGYAVRWSDVEAVSSTNPKVMPVTLEVPAGRQASAPLAAGTAARIMTGAPVPEGADTVIMREDTAESEHQVTIRALPKSGKRAHIRHRGSYYERGDLLLDEGEVVDPGAIGLLASVGVCRVRVIRPPRVAVVSTGNELVELGDSLGPSQIYNSSVYLLEGLIRKSGALPVILPIARDTLDSCEQRLNDALASADMVVTLGGVSVGDYDVVREALTNLGSEMGFWKVKMKPGKPLAFGMVAGKPILGLPGNPVSGFVCFHQFVRPAIGIARGLKNQGRLPTVQARLLSDLRSPASRAEFQRGRLYAMGEQWEFEPLPTQGSGNSTTMTKVNALGLVPAGVDRMSKDDMITVERLPE